MHDYIRLVLLEIIHIFMLHVLVKIIEHLYLHYFQSPPLKGVLDLALA